MTVTSPPGTAVRKQRKRAPGRPGGSEGGLREALLDAALLAFAEHGYAATTLAALARAAQVTPALAHYYFGSKALLLAALVEERLLPLLAGIRAELAGTEAPPLELAASFVAAINGAVQRHPWLPALWLREIVSSGGALRELLLERMAPLLPQALAARFATAQAHGLLPAGLDPRLLVVSLVGLSLFPAAAAPLWQRLFAAPELGPTQLAAHTLALLRTGLAPPPAVSGASR